VQTLREGDDGPDFRAEDDHPRCIFGGCSTPRLLPLDLLLKDIAKEFGVEVPAVAMPCS
jgi:hypothetical protein